MSCEDRPGILLVMLVSGCLLAASAGVAIGFSASECALRWQRTGRAFSYGPIQGCMVKRIDGTWINEKALRALNAL